MSVKKKRIGVMMGGRSAEKDISLKSGSAVLEALESLRIQALPLVVSEESLQSIRRLIADNRVDIIFVAMHGGFGEGGGLQHILEKCGIPYTGPTRSASRLAMDKIVSRRCFKKAGLNVPRSCSVKKGVKESSLKRRIASFNYPLVIKPNAQGSSIGISFIDTSSKLSKALSRSFKFGGVALIEEFIRGREITVAVLDGRALPVVEIIPKKKFFDFQAKYEKGMTEYVVPAVLDKKIVLRAQRDAVKAYHALGCRHLSRVDMIIDEEGKPVILEVNTIPGMTATSLFPKAAAAAGIGFPELCIRLLEMANG